MAIVSTDGMAWTSKLLPS